AGVGLRPDHGADGGSHQSPAAADRDAQSRERGDPGRERGTQSAHEALRRPRRPTQSPRIAPAHRRKQPQVAPPFRSAISLYGGALPRWKCAPIFLAHDFSADFHTVLHTLTGFISTALDVWAYRNGVKLCFSRPGKPTDNAYIESFNGKLR